MATSYKWLQTYFDETLPAPEKLESLFNAHAFEVDGMEKKNDDTIFDIKVLPDRAHYALCHRGIAGEIQAITGLKLKVLPPPSLLFGKMEEVKVNVEDSKRCPRYVVQEIKGVTVKESPVWLKERLESVGQRSINALVDIMNFVMLDIGQPMHVFDADKINGSISVRLAQEGEKITTLDGKEVSLSTSDLVIADDWGILAIAGVKGGKKAEVDENTKNIIIESANFEPTSTRRTSTRLNLRTDASKRFENEITPDLAGEAMEKATALVLELCGGEAGNFTDVYPHKAEKWQVETSVDFISSVIGEKISEKDIVDILLLLGCEISSDDSNLVVTPPLARLDLKIPEDFADEVGRIRGYENLPSVLPPDIGPTPVDKTFYYSEKIKNNLISLGFSEVLLYSLVDKGSFEILKPLAEDKGKLRENIAPKMIESLQKNAVNADLLGLDDIKLFEIGKVFPADGEKTVLCLGVRKTKKKKGETADTVLKEMLTKLGIEAEIKEGIAEIDFDTFISQFPEPKNISDLNFKILSTDLKYKPFSIYPFMVRDIAVFVPESVKPEEVLDIITTNATDLLVRHTLFDTFQKDGKISYAFRLIFQSYECTLTDDEINTVMNAVSSKMTEKDWEVR
ncbi:MAG: phenylalanine--tRNA ligase subunit beta [Candidatus Paceibacterota bacterium]|jgi:phenylalanyl-tRNA synthetase beta chain